MSFTAPAVKLIPGGNIKEAVVVANNTLLFLGSSKTITYLYNGIENQDRKLKWKFNPNLPEPWKKEQDANSAQTSKRKS